MTEHMRSGHVSTAIAGLTWVPGVKCKVNCRVHDTVDLELVKHIVADQLELRGGSSNTKRLGDGETGRRYNRPHV